jgi:hypothetical protein
MAKDSVSTRPTRRSDSPGRTKRIALFSTPGRRSTVNCPPSPRLGRHLPRGSFPVLVSDEEGLVGDLIRGDRKDEKRQSTIRSHEEDVVHRLFPDQHRYVLEPLSCNNQPSWCEDRTDDDRPLAHQPSKWPQPEKHAHSPTAVVPGRKPKMPLMQSEHCPLDVSPSAARGDEHALAPPTTYPCPWAAPGRWSSEPEVPAVVWSAGLTTPEWPQGSIQSSLKYRET